MPTSHTQPVQAVTTEAPGLDLCPRAAHLRSLYVILIIAVLLRVGAALALGDQVVELPGTYDQISYHNLALRVLGGHGFSFGQAWWPATPANAPTAHWSYLYTLYLAAVYAIFGAHPLAARVLQAVIVGLLQPYLVFLVAGRVCPPANDARIGRTRLVFSEVVPLLAAAITAIYGYFIYYASTLMTEPFYICGILGALYCTLRLADGYQATTGASSRGARRLAVVLGVTLACTVLLRQLFLIFVPFLYLWLAGIAARQKQWTQWGRTVALSAAIIVLAILPFTVYNYSRFGHFVLLNTNSGFAFFWGNHPIYGTHFQPILTTASYQSLIPPELSGLDEAALDQALLRRGLGFVTADPRRYLLLSLSRFPSYFMFWPDSQSGLVSNITRVGSFGLFLPFMIYGLWRLIAQTIRQRRQPVASDSAPLWAQPATLLLLFMTIYAGMHLLTWTLIRYRLPVDAVLVIFAAYGLTDLAGRLLPRRSTAGAGFANR
jgi:hypothetical protein